MNQPIKRITTFNLYSFRKVLAENSGESLDIAMKNAGYDNYATKKLTNGKTRLIQIKNLDSESLAKKLNRVTNHENSIFTAYFDDGEKLRFWGLVE